MKLETYSRAGEPSFPALPRAADVSSGRVPRATRHRSGWSLRDLLGALLVSALLGSAVPGAAQQSSAQDPELPESAPSGAILPENLNDLGSRMTDRFRELIQDEVDEVLEEPARPGAVLDLFSTELDEDPNLTEIRRIARDLETQRSLILKVADLQDDLITFGENDPHAAYRSRIPATICELAIASEVCANLTGSFR